jgi:hypothetical protein
VAACNTHSPQPIVPREFLAVVAESLSGSSQMFRLAFILFASTFLFLFFRIKMPVQAKPDTTWRTWRDEVGAKPIVGIVVVTIRPYCTLNGW